jgi:hypothetical protein
MTVNVQSGVVRLRNPTSESDTGLVEYFHFVVAGREIVSAL